MSRSRRSRSRLPRLLSLSGSQSHPDVSDASANLSEYQLAGGANLPRRFALMQTAERANQQAVTQAQDSLTQARQAQLQAQ